MKKIEALGLSLLLNISLSYGQTIETQIKVIGIRSERGNIKLTIFKDSEGFEKSQPVKNLVFQKKAIVGGNLILTFKIEPGIYGIILLDDENSNGKMDKNFIRMSKEGFGFSNFMMKFKKPSFDDFKVNLTSDPSKTEIKVRYF